LLTFLTLVVGVVVGVFWALGALGAAKMATAESRVMLMSFFIWILLFFVAAYFVRPQSYFAWNCVGAPSREWVKVG
jgi:hypothetical protein